MSTVPHSSRSKSTGPVPVTTPPNSVPSGLGGRHRYPYPPDPISPPPGSPDAPATVPWLSLLLTDDHGHVKHNQNNATVILRHHPDWTDCISWDVFYQRIRFRRRPPGDIGVYNGTYTGMWSENDDGRIANWLQQQRIDVGTTVARKAALIVADLHTCHPVVDYLRSLQWDGQSRIYSWLHRYLGVTDTPLHSAFGSKFLVGAVARAFRQLESPESGCKVDNCLFLEGAQGTLKSSAVRALAGGPDPSSTSWYTDTLHNIGNREAPIGMLGKWIVEVAENESFSGVGIDKVKKFLSRDTDRYRDVFGIHNKDVARGCVFVGTVNAEEYLTDVTGNRRYWPVRTAVTSPIQVSRLARDRDQLWAEAVVWHTESYPHWLDSPELIEQADVEQRERVESDPLEAHIREWLTSRSDTSVSDILRYCLVKPVLEWQVRDKMRIGKILTNLRWTRHKKYASHYDFEWRYYRPGSRPL